MTLMADWGLAGRGEEGRGPLGAFWGRKALEGLGQGAVLLLCDLMAS